MKKIIFLLVITMSLPLLLGFGTIPPNRAVVELEKVDSDKILPKPGQYNLELDNVTVMGGQAGGLEILFKNKSCSFALELGSTDDFAVYSSWDKGEERSTLKAKHPPLPFTLTEKDFERKESFITQKGPSAEWDIEPDNRFSFTQEEGEREGDNYICDWVYFNKFELEITRLRAKDNKLSMNANFALISEENGKTTYTANGGLNISNSKIWIKHY